MPQSVQTRPYEFDLSGGFLCLDFANTVSRRKLQERAVDHLRRYDDLVAFAWQSKLVSQKEADDLWKHAQRRSRVALAVLQRAILYREAIYGAFAAAATGAQADSGDVQQINDFALEALTHRQLESASGRYRWEWHWNSKNVLEHILWPIAESAAALLTSPELHKVRMCEAPSCAWLFLDHSRNRSRRWCDMKVCGNRQKARRHYQRMRL